MLRRNSLWPFNYNRVVDDVWVFA